MLYDVTSLAKTQKVVELKWKLPNRTGNRMWSGWVESWKWCDGEEAEGVCRSYVPTISSSSYILQVINSTISSIITVYFIHDFFTIYGWNTHYDLEWILKRLNGIQFEEIKIDTSKRHQLSPQYTGTIWYNKQNSMCFNLILIFIL